MCPRSRLAGVLLAFACGRAEPAAPIVLGVEDVETGSLDAEPARRAAAVGPLDGLDPALQRAFSERVGHVPLPPPGPEDWLALHPEPGQTFEQWLRSGPNLPDDERRVVYLQPIGWFPSQLLLDDDGVVLVPTPPLSLLEEYAELYFGLPVEVLPALDTPPAGVHRREHFGRSQLLATDILRVMARKVPADAYCVIAVTMEDLYPAESWNFVFGYASLRERVGVYSFARYDPGFYGESRDAGSRSLILRRGLKVMAHEIGHMFGIEHCTVHACVMNGTNHLEESDSRPLHPCPVCLRKLHHAVGFSPATRLEALARFYAREGLRNEAAWAQRRLEWIERGEDVGGRGSD